MKMLLRSLLLLLPALVLGETSRVLEAVKAALDYYHHIPPPLSSGLLFGVILLEGQLYGRYFEEKETQHEIHQMIKVCDDILQNNPRAWLNLHTVKRLGRGLARLKQEPEESVGQVYELDYELEENLLSGRPTPEQSTYCILEALQGSRMSTSCFRQETDPEAKGYTLSHQAIYFMLNSAMRINPNLSEEILSKLCEKVLSEVNYSWKKGLPADLVDLFIEEVAVCGMSNFKEFLTKSILDFILSLQQEDGCFSLRSLGTLDKCEDHLSAVSMVALGNFLHYQSKDVNQG